MDADVPTVYVANLPWLTTEDELAALFGEHVGVRDARIIQDPATGRSRGYGFVELDSPESVDRAVANLNGSEFKGRRLSVSPAHRKPPRH